MSIGGLLGGSGLGGAIGKAVVALELDTAKYNAELNKAQASTTAGAKQMSTGVSQFSAVAKAGLAAAGIAAVKFAADSVKAAIESEKALVALRNAVGPVTKAYEDQATALQLLTGFEDEQILAADTILARFELTEKQIRATIPLVLDYARATGKDVPASAEMIGKALLGNTRALKAVGIGYTVTGDRAKDLAAIHDLLRDKVGGAAVAFGKTLGGQMAIFHTQVDELQESLGKALIPTLTDLAKEATELVQIVGPVMKLAFEGVAAAAHDIASEVKFVTDAFEFLVGLLPGVNAASEDTVSIWDRLLKAGQELARPDVIPFKNLADAWNAYNEAGEEGVRTTETISAALLGLGDDLRGRFLESLDLAGDKVSKFAGLSIEEFGKWQGEISGALKDVSGFLGDLADDANLTTAEIVKGFAEQAEAIVEYQGNWQELLRRGLPDELTKQLADMGLEGAPIIDALADANSKSLSRIIASFNKGERAADGVAAAFRGIGDAANAIPTDISINIRTDYSSQLAAAGGVVGAASGAVIAAANGFITQGATLMRANTILAGEGSYHTRFGRGAEAILPLTDQTLRRLGAAIASEMGQGQGGGTTVNVNVGTAYGMADFERQVEAAAVRALSRLSMSRMGL